MRLETAWPLLPALMGVASGCAPTRVVQPEPSWADVAPIFRGQCNGCHGWTAKETGGSYRFDFFDMTADVCGDAALALGQGLILAGSGLASGQIPKDVQIQQTGWARMPPPPSPALPDWERQTLENWAALPMKGSMPPGNRPPTLEISQYPSTADTSLAFTAVLSDPDDDAALGVVEVNGLAFLMDRTGSFNVTFDSSTWPAGPQNLRVVLCDGWTKSAYAFNVPVQIAHAAR